MAFNVVHNPVTYTRLTVNQDGLINGLTVGQGAGSVSTNTAVGASALVSNTTGSNNVSFGYQSLYSNTTANNNTAVGYQAGYSNTTGSYNTAVGYQAGYTLSGSSGELTALGSQAGYSYNPSTETNSSTFIGVSSGKFTTTGHDNTFVGGVAGYQNTSGTYNVALGAGSLQNNTTANYNTAVGYQAGYSTTTSGYSVYFGQNAGYNTTGGANTFVGSSYAGGSGYLITSGAYNTIIGGYTGNQGGLDIRTASNYIVLSDGAGNPRQIIDNNGNLGLGVAPSAWSSAFKALQIGTSGVNSILNMSAPAGAMVFNSYYNGTNYLYQNSSYAGRFDFNYSTSGGFAWNLASSGTAGGTASFTQAMTLDNSGQLWVLNTPGSGVPSGFAFTGTSASILYIGHASGTSSGAEYMEFRYNSNGIGSITQNGTTGVLYNTSSDQRLKTNIVDAPEGNVDAIKVRSFDWIADGSHQTYGMVAQELLEVAPYAVSVPENPEEMMGVDYSKLVPMLIKEIQSLRARVAQLEAKGS